MADSTKAFDQLAPSKQITDPLGLGAQGGGKFPAHLYRHVAESSETSLVVAWKGKAPIHNEVLEVGDQKALDEALDAGWSDKPVLEAAGKAKPKKD